MRLSDILFSCFFRIRDDLASLFLFAPFVSVSMSPCIKRLIVC